ncbi:SIR2 family protein [uncultured Christiangramia sp.]|uniref:SIR2 family protein n=1 Tax=uncultured Christiangramia sp. TaxID=503836 RepID=UPI00262786BC|nr:SIR2 family protein [uncultured Christiangramia sp.]
MITIEKDKFLRSFKVQGKNSFDIFLGSGASVSSGIPTGGELILHFKREILISQSKINSKKFSDLKIESIRNEVNKHFEDKNLKNPYSHYFEEFLQHPEDRRDFLTNIVKDKKPSIGFLCLASLVEQEKFNTLWTTNFDDLIEKAINSLNYKSCQIVSPENAISVNNFRADIPTVVKLHGDFRYDSLQNTDKELKELEGSLHDYFISSASTKGLLIIGYSGSDQSIMSTLSKIANGSNPFPKGLIWGIPKGVRPNNDLIKFMSDINKKNNRSGFIEIDSFDYFMHELYKISDISNERIDGIAKTTFEERSPFALNENNSNGKPILLNSLKVEYYPKSVFATTVNFQGEGQWKKLREVINEKQIAGAFYKRQLLLLGSESEIQNTFSEYLEDDLKIKDVDDKHFHYSDSYFTSLLYQLIEKVLVSEYDLKLFKKGGNFRRFYSDQYLITSNSDEIRQVYEKYRPKIPADLRVHDSFEFRLEFVSGNLFFFILPSIHITNLDGSIPDKNRVQFLTNKILSNRYNDKYGKKINVWLNRLKNKNRNLNFDIGEFKLKFTDYFSTAAKQGKSDIHWFSNYAKLNEPKIFFHHSDTSKKLIRPLEGLKFFGPLDESYELTNSKINLAIVSPEFGFQIVKNHLESLLQQIDPRSEKEYLSKYPGFGKVYKKQLIIPDRPDNDFVILINNQEIAKSNAIQFYEIAKSKIDKLAERNTEIDCVIIYIPDSWKNFRELKNKQTYFDLHDSLKIYGVKKGLKIQFIEDKSINYFDQAKIRWWLSLGIYVKANGTPWRIEPDENETAFVGLSYAVRNSANNKVVLGSSQIFDGNGNGLKFLLQPIEKPIYYGKSPFMSKEDAFRLVSNIRNTYYKIDPLIGLKKLVLHKTTRFTKAEIEGISNALEGVENIELIQIQQFTNWRAINLKYNYNKEKFEIDGFPIERGSIIQLDDHSFLLWTHGLIEHPEFNKKYYQGKRGIPSPILIKRFKGTDSIKTVAKDILKLTKMNWNGAELYKTHPVTIDFSQRLSVMGKQLEDLEDRSYDFRYFI